jgi:hypothetical protein
MLTKAAALAGDSPARKAASSSAGTAPLPMWAWIVATGTERILIDTGGARGRSVG